MSQKFLIVLSLVVALVLRFAVSAVYAQVGQGPNQFGSSNSDYFDDRLIKGQQRVRTGEIQPLSRKTELEAVRGLVMTHTDVVDGTEVVNYVRNISSEYVFSIGQTSGLARLSYIESNLQLAREAALNDLRQKAFNLGANAVVSLDIDYSSIGSSGFAVIVTGTAVVVQ